jgi:isopentenyl-diphosphate delta-isomerase type 1
MADEYIDIVNEDNELTGVSEQKSIAHKNGLWHRAAHVWIYNSQREVLLQRRASNKDFYPDMWDFSVGGHVTAGESVERSAVREVKEEIGISIDMSELECLQIRKIMHVFNNLRNHEFQYVYVLKKDILIEDMVKQDTEVADLGWFSIEEVLTMKRNNEVLPHPKHYWEYMMDIIQACT